MNVYLVSGALEHGEYIAGLWCVTETEQVCEIVYERDLAAAVERFEQRYGHILADAPVVLCVARNVNRRRRGFGARQKKLECLKALHDA